MNSNFCLVMTSVSAEHQAVELAKKVIEFQLGRCVQIIPKIRSIYYWDGEICDDDEWLLLIKTRSESIEPLMQHLPEWHPYELPEMIVLPLIAGYEPYLHWLSEWKYNGEP
ncbi:divalent-cation tolerance protein CutA [bacterium]|nr:divalent-cation tolerance protein CutA [candidate division CSSED10-310 bacterium]